VVLRFYRLYRDLVEALLATYSAAPPYSTRFGDRRALLLAIMEADMLTTVIASEEITVTGALHKLPSAFA
jgi:hypothetical protein